jgi:chromosome segregation ATPase
MSEFEDTAETVREIAKRDREIETLRARVKELESELAEKYDDLAIEREDNAACEKEREAAQSMAKRAFDTLVKRDRELAAVTKERDDALERDHHWNDLYVKCAAENARISKSGKRACRTCDLIRWHHRKNKQ